MITLSNCNLSDQERQQLKLGLGYCFVDKNKDFRRFLAVNMASVAVNVRDRIDHRNLEHFHEFLRGYTYILINNILATKGYTYHNLSGLIQSKDIVVVEGGKSDQNTFFYRTPLGDWFCITKKSDYVAKSETMIHDGIIKDTQKLLTTR